MAKYTKEDIIEKANELAKMVAETEEVDFFKRAEAQIHENDKVRDLIAQIKGLQKNAVNLQHFGKEKALANTEAQIEKLEAELDEIPVVREFKQSQIVVNNLLQMISNAISNTITDEIIVATGGDVLRGQTGADYAKSSKCDHKDHDHHH